MLSPPLATIGLALILALVNGCGLLQEFDQPSTNGPDGLVPLPECGEPTDDATVALFRMDDVATGVLVDATGGHDGTFEGGDPEDTDGPVGCGRALVTGSPIHAVIAKSPAFQLTRGAVDLWVKLAGDRAARCQAFLSRDASYQDFPGHFTVYGDASGRIGFRLQSSPIALGAVFLFTGEPVPTETWVHVGINFGPDGVSLFVDGVRETSGDPGDCGAPEDSCTSECTTSIEGNDNPWTVGTASTSSTEGTADRVTGYFSGALDELRISNAQRDFVGPGP